MDQPGAPAFADRLAGFGDHWRSIEPELHRIEARRWVSVIGGILLCIAGVAAFLVGGGVVESLLDTAPGAEGGGFAVAVLGGGLFALGGYIARRPSRLAGRLIKERVVGFLGFSYKERASGFPLAAFDANDLLPSYTGSSLRDDIEGEVSGVPLRMCDAKLTVRKGSGKSSRTVTVFRGPLVVSRFPKPCTGRTIVVPDGGGIGNFFGGLSQSAGERVRLESPDFERAFEAYSSDQVEARYLLTPTMMERLLAFRDRYGARIRLAFTGGDLLLALDDRRDWFPDPGFFQRLTDPALVQEQAEEVARVAGIVEALKLDARSRI